MESQERIFRETRNVSRLNILWDRARAEKNSHSPDSEYRAIAQLDFEDFVTTLMEESRELSEYLRNELQETNDRFGSGKAPRERWDPEYMEWKEATQRYLICQYVLYRSGFGGIERKGGTPTPKIHLYNEDPYRWIGQLVEERLRNIKNAIIMLVGDTGSAKTYSGINLGRYLGKRYEQPLTLDGVCLDEESFFNRIGDDQENVVGRVTVADDMSKWANAREYGGDINIILAKMFDIFRSRGEIIIITTPKETKIDKSIRENIHIYLIAPNKNSQGIFMPADPVFDEKGKIESQNYYKFPGYTLLSQGADCDSFEIIIDTVKFPFDGMHEMTPEEIRQGIMDIQQSAREKGSPVPSESDIRSKLRPGRDCRGTPWPNDPFLRGYELKKREIFGEAVKEGRYVIEQAKKKKKFEDEKMQEQIDEMEYRRTTKVRRRAVEEEKLALKEQKARMEREKLSRPSYGDRLKQLYQEGLTEQDISDKMMLEGYDRASQPTVHRKIMKLVNSGELEQRQEN